MRLQIGARARKNLSESLLIAIFVGVASILMLLTVGLYYEAAVAAGKIVPETSLVKPTIPTCLILGSPLVTIIFILTSINVFVSTRFDIQGHSGIIFPTLTFTIVFIGTVLCQYRVQYQFNWVVWIATVMFAGIAGLSHGNFMGFKKCRESINNLVSSVKNTDALIKRIELEHISLSNMLQWVIWGSIIFLTAGVAGYYYSPFGNPQESIVGTRLLIALILSTWAVLGMIFGSILPASKLMEFLRDKLGELSLRVP